MLLFLYSILVTVTFKICNHVTVTFEIASHQLYIFKFAAIFIKKYHHNLLKVAVIFRVMTTNC